MTGSLDSYAEIATYGTLFVLLVKAQDGDAPVLFVPNVETIHRLTENDEPRELALSYKQLLATYKNADPGTAKPAKPAKKAAAKPAVKKAAAKPAAKKPATRKVAKPAAKKPAKKPATKKQATKKPAAKKLTKKR
jgi:hypothetical protein